MTVSRLYTQQLGKPARARWIRDSDVLFYHHVSVGNEGKNIGTHSLIKRTAISLAPAVPQTVWLAFLFIYFFFSFQFAFCLVSHSTESTYWKLVAWQILPSQSRVIMVCILTAGENEHLSLSFQYGYWPFKAKTVLDAAFLVCKVLRKNSRIVTLLHGSAVSAARIVERITSALKL